MLLLSDLLNQVVFRDEIRVRVDEKNVSLDLLLRVIDNGIIPHAFKHLEVINVVNF